MISKEMCNHGGDFGPTRDRITTETVQTPGLSGLCFLECKERATKKLLEEPARVVFEAD